MTTLTIYVLADCPGCERARQHARAVRQRRPDIHVVVVDLGTGEPAPEGVSGVPAYTIDGRIVSHGNPRLETLLEWLPTQAGA